MHIESVSEARELRDRAQEGELTSEELDQLLAHADEAMDQYTATTVTAVAYAIQTGPEEYFDRAKPLVYGLIEAVGEMNHAEIRSCFLNLANSLIQVAHDRPAIVDDEYVDLTTSLEDTTGLEPAVLSAVLSMPIIAETDRDFLTLDRFTEYCDTGQRVIQTVPYDELPGPLGMVCSALMSSVEHADDEQYVVEAIDRIDILLLIGNPEPPIRTAGLQFIERLANLNPEPLGLYVSALITRLDESREPTEFRSDSVIQDMSEELLSSASRREATARALASLSEAHPDRCRPIIDRLDRLLADDSPAVQLSAVKISVILQHHLDESGIIDPVANEEQFKQIIEASSDTKKWFVTVTTIVQELIFSENEAEDDLAISVSESFVDALATKSDNQSEEEIVRQLFVLAPTPTPPIVEFITNLDISEDTVAPIERMLVKIVCNQDFNDDLVRKHDEPLRSLIVSRAPDLVAEGDLEPTDVEKTVELIDPQNGMTNEFATELEEAKPDTE